MDLPVIIAEIILNKRLIQIFANVKVGRFIII